MSFYPPWGGGRPKLHLLPTGKSASPTAAASNKTPGEYSRSPAGRFRASPGNRGWGRGRGWGRDPASYAAAAGGRSCRLCRHPGLRWRTGVSLRSCPRVSSLGVSSCLPTEKPTTSLALFLIRKTRLFHREAPFVPKFASTKRSLNPGWRNKKKKSRLGLN